MPGLGDEFRAAREARHLSLSDVSEQIHIRSVYLEGIEDEEWSVIAAPVYVRGFLRAYARFLGLDGEAAVAYFNASQGRDSGVPSVARETAVSRRRRGRGGSSPWLWPAALAAAILVGLVGYNLFAPSQSREPARVMSVAAPSASDAGTPATKHARAAASEAGAETLDVRLTEKSWLSISVDGNQRLIGIFPAGTHKAFHGKLADVRAGNAGAVELTVNGKELGTLGPSGGVVERSISLAEQ